VNVTPLRRAYQTSSENLPIPLLRRLGAVIRELDDLRRCIERILANTHGSPREWKVMCTPLLLRLPAARQALANLAGIRAGQWPDTDWAVRLRAAHDEVDGRLLDVSMAVNSLAHREMASIGEVANLDFDGAKLAEALDGLCHLIASQYPKVLDSL